MAYILNKLHKAVKKNLDEIRENNNEDELKFSYTLELAYEYLSKINVILNKNKDIFGYSTKVATLSYKQWKYLDCVYNLLVKIYKTSINNLICPTDISNFNKLATNKKNDLTLTLRSILNSLE